MAHGNGIIERFLRDQSKKALLITEVILAAAAHTP